jgi:hypothetical protein
MPSNTPYGYLLDIQPDWDAGVKDVIGFHTNIRRNRAGAEQMTSWRDKVKLGIEYEFKFAMSGGIRNAISKIQKSTLVMPLWTHPIDISEVAFGGLVCKPHDGVYFNSQGEPNSYNSRLIKDLIYVEGHGVFPISEITPERMTLTGWDTAPCTIYPVFIGRATKFSWKASGPDAFIVSLQVEELCA